MQETIRSDRWLRNIDANRQRAVLCSNISSCSPSSPKRFGATKKGMSNPPPKAVRVHVPNKLPLAVRVEERLLNQAVKIMSSRRREDR